MTGFSFPPPPPPPPKAGHSQNAFAGNGPNFSNRGRGRGRGRGAGHVQSGRTEARGIQPPGQAENRQNGLVTSHNGGLPNWQTIQLHAQSQNLPAGAFINPNFVPRQEAPQDSSAHGYNCSSVQAPNASRDSVNQHGSPSRTFAGHKRKLEALRGPPLDIKPAPPTAPSVPSFGATVVTPASRVLPATPTAVAAIQPTPRTTSNLLGLTPTTWEVQYSSSDSNEDDDDERAVDEEAMHAELGDKLTFEHNGIVMSLNSQADLVAWKHARQKNWPTRARMAERDVERRNIGEERKRLLAEADSLLSPNRPTAAKWKLSSVKEPMYQQLSNGPTQQIVGADEATNAQQPKTELEKVKIEVAEHTMRLEELRKKVAESEARNREAQARNELHVIPSTTNDDSPEAIKESEPGAPSNTLPESVEEDDSESEGSSSQESSLNDSSDSSSEKGPEDGPPEEITSKPVESTTRSSQAKVCRYFAASGYCRDGNGCRFRHERSTESMRMTRDPLNQSHSHGARPSRRQTEQHIEKQSLYHRLLEQDEERDDRLALKVVKYLGQAGHFRKSAGSDAV